MVTVASYNLENMFARPKAFNTGSWTEGEEILAAYREFIYSEPRDATKDVQITATGRDDRIGWLELATEATDEAGTRMTARVIGDVNAGHHRRDRG